MKKRYLLLLVIVIFGAMFWLLFKNASAPVLEDKVTDTKDTLAPEVAPAQKDDLITVESPLPGSMISSPLLIRGKARGNWYFEASFPVELVDAVGTVLAVGHATAQGEWMTSEYVPFTATLNYTAPVNVSGTKGFLILRKDNPSGEARFDNSLSIPVTI
jgi:hypothetical protein